MNKQSIIVTVVIALIVSLAVSKLVSAPAKIVYVDTTKLLLGFSEANTINKELEGEQKEYETNLQALRDSVKNQMDVMSKEFDASSDSVKLEMRKKLQQFNENMNRYESNGREEMMKRHQEKLTKVLQKVNAFIEEYAKANGVDLVLGSTQAGNILYGSESKFNITDELVKGLNKRYQ